MGAGVDQDSGYEPSSDTDDRIRMSKRGARRMLRRRAQNEAPKKRHVMLTIGGHVVMAS